MISAVWIPAVTVAGAVVAAGLLASTAQAAMVPHATQVDERVRIVEYEAGEVYELHARVGYQIELELEAGEEYLGHGAGDLAGIEVAAFSNHVFLKPKAADVRTNLMLATDRREYRFDYIVEGPSSQDLVMYLVQFVYPPVLTLPRVTEADRVEGALREASARRSRNVDYWYCGDSAVRPVAASDDGVHTRLRFDVHAELPALFVRNDDGSESLLNFSMDNGDVIVHRVARRLVVRRGALTGCIVNQGFVGQGQRLESGTVTPEVIRERKEVRP
jgi:type IV secretion system protein VirB9